MTSSTSHTTSQVLNLHHHLTVAVGALQLAFFFSLLLSDHRACYHHNNVITSLLFSAFSFGRRAHYTNIILYCHRHYILLLLLLYYYMRRRSFVRRQVFIVIIIIDLQAPAQRSQPTVATSARHRTQSPDETALSPLSSPSRDTVRGLRTLSLARRQSTCCARDDYLICHTRVQAIYINCVLYKGEQL